ncbi:MAG: enoyl-CoA hydratase-related protein [Thermoanaerobaculia bacterium]
MKSVPDASPIGNDLTTLAVRHDGWALHVTLDRPEVKNAMSSEMVSEVSAVFESIADAGDVRCVVLRGAAETFCAGADVRDMSALRHPPPKDGEDPAVTTNRAFGTLLTQIDRAPQAVVCVVEGVALGGGLGLVCVSDVALTIDSCRFGTPEAKLGLVPAQIMSFVVHRVGPTAARRLAVTGAMIDGREARRLGLVHESFADATTLEAAVDETLRQISRCGPRAVAAAKAILHSVGTVDHDRLLDDAATIFARTVRSGEAREGIAAFLDKRLPDWA